LSVRHYRQHGPTSLLELQVWASWQTERLLAIDSTAAALISRYGGSRIVLVVYRAKNIKNQAVVNEDADQRTLLRKYERELRKLRAELTRRNKELVDKRHLLEVRVSGFADPNVR
jgi:kinesin family protein 3/17